ncbi:MAG: PEP-CTERM sorting domain-containing protein [Blastocatellia bacterium]
MQITWEKACVQAFRLTTALFLLVGVAMAAPITFTANTTGTFNQGTCVTCTVDNNVVPTITSSGGGGLAAIGFVSSTGTNNTPQFTTTLDTGQSALVTLGTLTAASSVPLGTGPNFTGSTFALNVSFIAPAGTTPNSGALTATLTGQLTQTSSGVQLQFNSTPLTFTQGGQTFTLTLQPSTVTLTTQSNVALTAMLTLGGAAAIPEPTTLLLLGSGPAALSGLVKRRGKRQD